MSLSSKFRTIGIAVAAVGAGALVLGVAWKWHMLSVKPKQRRLTDEDLTQSLIFKGTSLQRGFTPQLIVLCADNIIYSRNSSGAFEKRPGIEESLDKMLPYANVFFLCTVQSDEEEEQVLLLLEEMGILAPKGDVSGLLDRGNVLFNALEDGRAHMARQLAPDLLIEASPAVAAKLAPHIPEIILVHAPGSGANSTKYDAEIAVLESRANCHVFEALEDAF